MPTQQQILDKLIGQRMIPLFTHDDLAVAREVIDVCHAEGIRVFEFTNRHARAYDNYVELHSYARNRYPDLLLGIGTVMDAPTASRFIEAGAPFIISPILDLPTGALCAERQVPWIPGCATLTEIVTATRAGAQLVKLFPGSVLGPGFVKAIMPVVPGLKLMITGGVEAKTENLKAWFESGAACVGMGSQLFTPELLQARDWDRLRTHLRKVREIVGGIE